MSNDYFFEPGRPEPNATYQTGATRPPKGRSGLTAVLLVLVILLCGAVTLLGVMNYRMIGKLNAGAQGEALNIAVYENGQGSTIGADPVPHTKDSDPVQIATSPTGQETATGGLSLQEIYLQCIPSVASIRCESRSGTSTGTGVVLTADGYIVTNSHVVEGAQQIYVLLYDERELEARLVGADPASDLAVLWVETDSLTPAQLGDAAVLQVGDTVVAIGDPLGQTLRGTMTDGIVSAINRDVNVDGRIMNLIQTNAALNSGNSGGPLINCYGQVVGINTMKMGDSMSVAGVEGLGFAIPSNTVSDIVNQLISQGYVSGRPYLGIQGESVSSFYQFYYGMPYGVYITYVEPGSPAQDTGLQEGDILLTVDGQRLTGMADLESALYGYVPGDVVEITLYRMGRTYTGTVTVGEAKNG